MVIGICFSCDDIAMLPLHHLRNCSHMTCHDHHVSDMHCFGCCPYSPYYASAIAHEETPIVSSYTLGDFAPSYTLHDPHYCVHTMLAIDMNDMLVPHTCYNLRPNHVEHNNYHCMMDDVFIYHARSEGAHV